MPAVTLHLIVEGRVQGVFYRANTEQKARELGLTGTVRNLPGGEVEVYATGDEATLQELVDWCWQGPPYAKVTNVRLNRLPEVREFTSFKVVY